MKKMLPIALLALLGLVCGCEKKGEAKEDTRDSDPAHAAHQQHSAPGPQRQEANSVGPAGARLKSQAEIALARAQKQNRYLVTYFYGPGTKQREINDVIKKAGAKWKDRAEIVGVLVTAPEAREITRRCGVTRVPYTTMMAPNGAITARLAGIAGPEALAKGFVSPKTAELLRIMQADGITFLCLVNDHTNHGMEVIQTVQAAVARLGGIAEWVRVDPADPNETALLGQINVDPQLDTATTLVIAPTGIIVERLAGKITERELFDSFAKIMALNGGCSAPTATGGSACDPGAGVGSGEQCHEK